MHLMKFVSLVILIPFLWFGFNKSFSQNTSVLQKQIEEVVSHGNPITKIDLIKKNSLRNSAWFAGLKNSSKANVFTPDDSRLAICLRTKPALLNISMQLPNGTLSNLILQSQKLYSEDSKLLSSDDLIGIPLNSGVHYSGFISGVPGSMVALSIYEHEIAGVISTPEDGNIIIGKMASKEMIENNTNEHVIYFENDLAKNSGFECGVTESHELFQSLREQANAPQDIFENRCRTVKIFLECDYRMYQDRNLQKNQVVSYVTSVFNVVKALYANESVKLEISDIMVWTTQDPFPKTTLQNIIYGYAEYRKNNFKGDLAQLVSTYPSQGGIAFVNGMCTTYNGQIGPHSYAYIYNTFNTLPTYSWSVEVMAHELGHNFGSWHTHSCVWGPQKNAQIDNCQTPDVGSCNPGPTPNGGGTIMSYCHLTGVGINFSKGFGQEPGDILRNAVNNKPCLTAIFTPSQKLNLQGPYFDGDNLKIQAKPVNANYTYDWFHYDYKLPGKNDTFLDVKYSGIYKAAVSDNCTEYAAPDTIKINDFQVNLGCPVVKGKKDSIMSQIIVDVDNFAKSDTLIFPSGLFATIPTKALDILVELQTRIAPKNQSWVRSFLTSFQSPASVGITKNDYRPGENTTAFPNTPRSFSKILGRFDPAGSWIFTHMDDRNDNGIDAQVTISLVVKWRMPDTVLNCSLPICDGSLKTLDPLIPGASYKWSTGETSKTIQVNTPGSYAVTVTKGNKSSSHQVTLFSKNTQFTQSFNICEGENLRVGSSNYSVNGIYLDSLLAWDGCDSVVTTELNVWPKKITRDSIQLCYGGEFAGKKLFRDTLFNNILSDVNGCDSIHLIQIKISPEIKIDFTVNPLCENQGGSIEAVSSGGNGNFNYLWSNQSSTSKIENLKSGIYECVVTDGQGCIHKDSVELKNYDSVSVAIMVKDVNCFGEKNGNIELQLLSGTEPVNYLWSNSQTTRDIDNLAAGVYTLYILDQNGCRLEQTVKVGSPDLLLAELVLKPSSGSNGSAKLNVTGGKAPYVILWSTGETSEEISMLAPGSYSVSVTDANGCNRIDSFVIERSVGTFNPLKEDIFVGFNAGQNFLMVTSKEANLSQIELFDLSGKSIIQYNLSTAKQGLLPVGKIPPGIYLVKVYLDSKQMIYFRKIKSK